jgi:hypothetical protein
MAQLETARDVLVPNAIDFARQRLVVLRAFARTSPEAERRARAQIFGLENSQKAFQGRLDALQDPKAMARRAAREKELRDKIASDPALAASVGDAYDVIAAAEKKGAQKVHESRYVSFQRLAPAQPGGRHHPLRGGDQKPNEVRLEEYVDSTWPRWRTTSFARAHLRGRRGGHAHAPAHARAGGAGQGPCVHQGRAGRARPPRWPGRR